MDKVQVGIVTGLGEEVGRYFLMKFTARSKNYCRGVFIVEHNVDADLVISRLGESESVGDILLNSLAPQMVEHYQFIMIPCNSVHVASRYLRQCFGNRLIEIDEAVIALLARDARKGRFLILGTSTTVESGMYQDGLHRMGCESLVLPPEAQADFDDFIFNNLVSGKMEMSHLRVLRELEHRYMKLLGADYAILACTELCYLVQVFSHPLALEVDSLQALLDAGIERLQALVREESVHAY